MIALFRQPDTVLVMAENMVKAVIVCKTQDHGPKQLGTVSAELTQAPALHGVLECCLNGHISKFVLVAKKREPNNAHTSLKMAEPAASFISENVDYKFIAGTQRAVLGCFCS